MSVSTALPRGPARKKTYFSVPVILGMVIVLVLPAIFLAKRMFPPSDQPGGSRTKYNPQIAPRDFSSSVTNKYFQLTPGKKMIYRGITGSGTETIEVYVTREKKTVMGVETTVVWDRVWLDGELTEDTKDWFAQDKTGNVWYFGEDSKEMSGGKIVSRHGSWEAGVDGAKPGIIMKAAPRAGETFQEEYYPGTAEDRADVLNIDASASVPFGQFDECVQTKNYTPLEPGAVEHKYYCPDAGGVALETDEDGERVELIAIEFDTAPAGSQEPMTFGGTKAPLGGADAAPQRMNSPAAPSITQEQAKSAALKRVPGTVTDVATEIKFGKQTYVVEIAPANGDPETDVVIDMTTGEILAVEE